MWFSILITHSEIKPGPGKRVTRPKRRNKLEAEKGDLLHERKIVDFLGKSITYSKTFGEREDETANSFSLEGFHWHLSIRKLIGNKETEVDEREKT